MEKKWPLFVGIPILVTGVILRIFSDMFILWPILIIVLGASFKIYYLIGKVKKSEYRPGYEMIVLYIGLALFFTGLYLKLHHSAINPYIFMLPGISLKLFFIVVFIKKTSFTKDKQLNR